MCSWIDRVLFRPPRNESPCDYKLEVFVRGIHGATLSSVYTGVYEVEYKNGMERELREAFRSWNQVGKNAIHEIVEVNSGFRLDCETIILNFHPEMQQCLALKIQQEESYRRPT